MKKELSRLESQLQRAINKANLKYSSKARPDASLRTVLGIRGIGELRQIARRLGIAYYYRMKREELIDVLMQQMPSEDYLVSVMMEVTAEEWSIIEDAVKKGELISDINVGIPFVSLQRSGIIQSYYHEDALHLVVPDEIRAIYRSIEKKGFITHKHLMNVIDLYAQAAVTLYGAIEVDKLLSIINLQNEADVRIGEMKLFLEVRSNEDGNYYLYKDLIVDSSFEEDNFSSVNSLIKARTGKKMYIPGREEFLKYSDPYYFEATTQALALRKKLAKLLGDDGEAGRVTNGIRRLCSYEASIREISDYLNEMGAEFESFEELQQTINLVMEVNNSTRMWSNYGHTPNEINVLEKQFMKPLPKAKLDIENEVGRNEPCPCGSGKKFKHCCGKVH